MKLESNERIIGALNDTGVPFIVVGGLTVGGPQDLADIAELRLLHGNTPDA